MRRAALRSIHPLLPSLRSSTFSATSRRCFTNPPEHLKLDAALTATAKVCCSLPAAYACTRAYRQRYLIIQPSQPLRAVARLPTHHII